MERRDFLKAAGAATFAIASASAVKTYAANSKIALGITGCGGRGRWIGDLFEKNAEAKVVAVHDYFRDRVTEAGDKFGVDKKNRFVGLDGYKGLIESGVDAVAVESPPYFHPEQTVASLDAGKHVYLAKPIAVDVQGCKAITEAAARNKDKLTLVVDFQTRMNEFYQGAIQRVHEGMIGNPVSGHVYYIAGRLGIQAPPGSETARLRNWVFDKALSGDIIVEQNIHVLDVANWILKGHPLKANGTGGRKARVDVGDCWDHFVVTYWYPDDVLIDFSSAQYTEGFDDLCDRIYFTNGTIETHYGGNVSIRGKSGGWRGGNTATIYQEGAVANIKAFCASIAEGKPYNNAEESANSTMTSILGRMAAYQGRTVTWDEMLAANERLDPKLDLPKDGPDATA